MKTSISNIASSVALMGFILASSCTSDFDTINSDPNSIATPGSSQLPYLFSKAQSQAALPFWYYQVGQNLFADLYAQYFSNIATGFPSDRYNIRMDWVRWIWTPTYTEVVPQLKTLLDQYEPGTTQYAIANIWWVWTFHRLTDYWGPIPYTNAGVVGVSVAYDSQQAIYADFFTRLNASIATLKGKESQPSYGSFDLIYGGDVAKWIKFANTLKLRLALRISRADAGKAKTEAESAVASGVMTATASDDAMLKKSTQGNDVNGLSIMTPWNEFRMSASMESVLKGYDDPRAGEFFEPTAGGTFEGLRNGLTAGQLGAIVDVPKSFSRPGPRWTSSSRLETPQNIISTAEAYFLRAEGALNGWAMGGSAKDLYEAGIESSMQQWGITDAAAIAAYKASTKTPVAPGDFVNSPAMTNIPVAFHVSDQNIQREQIATQKWLALFPDGIEAWADFRRSGLPKLYPVLNSDNPDITNPATQRVRRIPFLELEKQTNKTAVDAAGSLLGGPDKVTTPLWWDKN